jgi:hypothetical protein
VVVTVAIALGAGAACGGEDTLSSDARARLAPMVEAARRDLESFHPDGARAQLQALRDAVAELRRDGDLSADQASRVLLAAAEVESHLDVAPTTTTTTTTAPPPPPSVVVRGGQEGKATEGKGKGKK